MVDEVIGPLLLRRWLEPVVGSTNPIADIKRAFRRYVKTDIERGHWLLGCPLNNLAQEMSPLDDGFRSRIDALYTRWRKEYAAAIAKGIKAGTVHDEVAPKSVAAMLVASQMGIWGTGKSSQNKAVMSQAAEAICDYLDTLAA